MILLCLFFFLLFEGEHDYNSINISTDNVSLVCQTVSKFKKKITCSHFVIHFSSYLKINWYTIMYISLQSFSPQNGIKIEIFSYLKK